MEPENKALDSFFRFHQLRDEGLSVAEAKRQMGDGSSRPRLTAADCPVGLDDVAAGEFRRAVECQRYEARDIPLLLLYTTAFSRWHRCEALVRQEGETIVTKSGNIVQNPNLGIGNAAGRLCLRFAKELLFSPASRAKGGAASEPRPFTVS